MKSTIPKHYPILIFLSLFFIGCIGEDFVDDFVEPSIRINNPITDLQTSSTHSYMATYLNNVGLPEDANITWSSSDDSIITIDDQGLATALTQGEVTISASVTKDGNTITDKDEVFVSLDAVENNQESNKSGTIVTTSGYRLEGSFTLEVSGNSLLLFIDDDYRASSSLPGLFLYLTNNPSTINGALEVGPVTTFEGSHSYSIANTGLNEYRYLLYWCKPFSVKVGEGQIN